MADDALVIAAVTRKGGAGKSMLVRILAGELAERGNTVGLVDADPQGTLSEWFIASQRLAKMPGGISLMRVDHRVSLAGALSSMSDKDVVIVDVAGEASAVPTEAALRADLVLLPARPHVDDVSAGLKTWNAIVEATRPQNPPLMRFVLNGMTALDRKQSYLSEAVGAMSDAGVKWFSTALMLRPIFQQMAAGRGTLYSMETKSNLDSVENARLNGRSLVDEIHELLEHGASE